MANIAAKGAWKKSAEKTRNQEVAGKKKYDPYFKKVLVGKKVSRWRVSYSLGSKLLVPK